MTGTSVPTYQNHPTAMYGHCLEAHTTAIDTAITPTIATIDQPGTAVNGYNTLKSCGHIVLAMYTAYEANAFAIRLLSGIRPNPITARPLCCTKTVTMLDASVRTKSG